MNQKRENEIFPSPKFPPCQLACPIGQNIQEYIACISEGRFTSAIKTVRETNPFPSICGRLCNRPCEMECIRTSTKLKRPIAIRELKRFIADLELDYITETFPVYSVTRDKKVAIIGAGISGLTVAYNLKRIGYSVTVFEKNSYPGGSLKTCFSDQIIPSEVIEKEIKAILTCGVEVYLDSPIGGDGIKSINTILSEGYAAVVIATGAGDFLPRPLFLKEQISKCSRIIDPLSFLTKMRGGQVSLRGCSVVIDGLSLLTINVALAARLRGAGSVTIISAYPEENFPIEESVLSIARAEGIKIVQLAKIDGIEVKSPGTGCDVTVKKLSVEKFGQRLSPYLTEKKPSKAKLLRAEFVIAGGIRTFKIAPFVGDPDVKKSPSGFIVCDRETMMVSPRGIFATGECAIGERNIVEIIANAHKTSHHIHRFLSGENLPFGAEPRIKNSADTYLWLHSSDFGEVSPEESNCADPVAAAEIRREASKWQNYIRVDTKEKAVREANNCLRCGCCSTCVTCHHYCRWVLHGSVDETAEEGRFIQPAVNLLRVDKNIKIPANRIQLVTGLSSVNRLQIRVDDAKCSGCGICEDVCPYDVISIFPTKAIDSAVKLLPRINESSCRGCGICYGNCPQEAIEFSGIVPDKMQSYFQLFAPEAVAFVCGHCNIETIEKNLSAVAKNIFIVGCIGQIPPRIVLSAALSGCASVIIVGCGEENCHNKTGFTYTKQNIEIVSHFIRDIGIENKYYELCKKLILVEEDKLLELPQLIEQVKQRISVGEKSGRIQHLQGIISDFNRWFEARKARRSFWTVNREQNFERQPEKPSISSENRVLFHPVIDVKAVDESEMVSFTFNGIPLKARKNEVITSALYANRIRIFGHHPRDGSPQGLFCANGQCGQCLVIANGECVKGCMRPVEEGMEVRSCDSPPELEVLPQSASAIGGEGQFEAVEELTPEVLVIGAGPSGLSAAEALSNYGVGGIIADDKSKPGGKLTLQTHFFFGSTDACYAGTRGIKIAEILTKKVLTGGKFEIWTDTNVVGVFVDGKFGAVRGGRYYLIKPRAVLVACGARERMIEFDGCHLPGVYGAGAFQTLLNRDLVLPARKLLIVGGGNVGLIAAYHALQAGIEVSCLVEALPHVSGYKVHLDKIKREGVEVVTSHTIIRAEGNEHVERAVISMVDEKLKPVKGTEKIIEADTILIAVGLLPVNELYIKAKQYGIPVWTAGDARQIAEASAAMLGGKIAGLKIAKHLGKTDKEERVPAKFFEIESVLKSRAGKIFPRAEADNRAKFQPVIRCHQEIPCNPCEDVCPAGCIQIPSGKITGVPVLVNRECLGCCRCVAVCPGLAITLVVKDYDPRREKALVIIPYEMEVANLKPQMRLSTVNQEGGYIGEGRLMGYKYAEEFDHRLLVAVEVPWADRMKVAGFRLGRPRRTRFVKYRSKKREESDPIVCRCERVRKSEIIREIKRGVRDMNELKATIRTGMGACGGKSCTPLIEKIFVEEGISPEEVTKPTVRPFVAEVPMKVFANLKESHRDR